MLLVNIFKVIYCSAHKIFKVSTHGAIINSKLALIFRNFQVS